VFNHELHAALPRFCRTAPQLDTSILELTYWINAGLPTFWRWDRAGGQNSHQTRAGYCSKRCTEQVDEAARICIVQPADARAELRPRFSFRARIEPSRGTGKTASLHLSFFNDSLSVPKNSRKSCPSPHYALLPRYTFTSSTFTLGGRLRRPALL
jgi:hypothetical protein